MLSQSVRGRSRLLRVALAVFLALVVFAGSAAAECAWVLWERSGSGTSGSETVNMSTEPVRAYQTSAECERTVITQLARFKTSGKTNGQRVVVLDDAQEAYVTTQSKGKFVTTSYGYFCLPDTVDPRAVKK